MVAKLRNNGESCLAANNVFVHADRYDEVVGRAARAARRAWWSATPATRAPTSAR